jgi:hypothetical protein
MSCYNLCQTTPTALTNPCCSVDAARRFCSYNVQMKLADALKTSLDEPRMQMLGAQVLLGFQFQSLFQDNFAAVGQSARTLDAAGMTSMVIALGLIAAIPCQHRLFEGGEATRGAHVAA